MKQKIFEVFKLENGDRYINIDKKEFENQEYYLLMQEQKPNLMAVAVFSDEIKLVDDPELTMKILNYFALDKDTFSKIKAFVSFN